MTVDPKHLESRVSETVEDMDAEGFDRRLPRSLAFMLMALSAGYAVFHLAVLNFWSIDEWLYRVIHVNLGAILAFLGLKVWKGEREGGVVTLTGLRLLIH